MRHVELLYKRLQEGKTKELIPEPRLRYIINRLRVRPPLYTFFKTKQGKQLQIKRVQLIGNIKKFKDVYISKPSQLILRAEYFNAGRTTKAKIYQQIGRSRIKRTVIFGKGASFKLDLRYNLERPEKLIIIADIRKRRWRPEARFEKVLTMGLADDKPRPVNTYPEPNAENEVLDLKTEWKEGVGIYPEKAPQDIVIQPKPIEYVSGIFKWDVAYRIPIEPAKVRCTYTVKNNSDKKVRIEEWSLMVTILYQDMLHMSYVNAKVGYDPRVIKPGQSTKYSFEVTLPEWVYGYVTITHAMKFYKDGMFAYGGGPIWNFRLGRVLLP